MKYCDFSKAKVGDKVWSSASGWMEIVKIGNLDFHYPLVAKDKDCKYTDFTIEGKLFTTDLYPTIFWNEFEIPEVAFVKPLPNLKTYDLVIVWGDDKSNKKYKSNKSSNKSRRHKQSVNC